jgi:hypothetical protein
MQREQKISGQRWFVTAAAAALGLSVLAGCTGEVVVERPHHCARGVWIEGHHDGYGRWHPGHWRCGYAHREVVVEEY